jgi:hypothetical protein
LESTLLPVLLTVQIRNADRQAWLTSHLNIKLLASVPYRTEKPM